MEHQQKSNKTNNFLGIILQRKWKNIRDRYARELKEKKGKSGQGRKGKSTYLYTNQLAFLSGVILPRTTDTSLNTMDPSSPNENGPPLESQVVLDEPSDVPEVSKKRKVNMVERKLLDAIETHNIRQKEKSKTEKTDDDDRLFLLSLLPFMKSIPPHFKLAARMDIMQTINKFITAQQPPANYPHPQQYNQNNYQPPGHQSQQHQFLNLMQPCLNQPPIHQPEHQPETFGNQSGSTGMQPLGHSFSVHQDPLPGTSRSHQHSAASSFSPVSLHSQDDTEMQLF